MRSPHSSVSTVLRKPLIDIAAPFSFLLPIIFMVACLAEVMEVSAWKEEEVLQWDVAGYYHYLPSIFIHDDLKELTFIRNGERFRSKNVEVRNFGMNRSKNGGLYYLKFTYGTALFELPFFLVAHAIACSPNNDHVADGYSAPYQLSVLLSTIFFVTFGLFILRRSLLRYADDISSSMALATLAFGTNLFFYSTFNAGMSHGYLFFLFALVLERTDAWHRIPTIGAALAIGVAAGLATITRPVDGLVLLIPLLWNCFPIAQAKLKWQLIKVHFSHVLLALAAFVMPLIPQLIYWHATTGNWLHYSYEGEGFHFQLQNIWNGLFSYRKGWIVYSPLIVLGLAGLIMMAYRRTFISIILPILVFFPIFICVVFSCHQWWYGGGLGARALVDALPLLALPIAWLAGYLWQHNRRSWIAMIVVIFIGTRLNMFQQYQYRQGLIHWDSMNKERYWEIFLKPNWDGLRPFPYQQNG